MIQSIAQKLRDGSGGGLLSSARNAMKPQSQPAQTTRPPAGAPAQTTAGTASNSLAYKGAPTRAMSESRATMQNLQGRLDSMKGGVPQLSDNMQRLLGEESGLVQRARADGRRMAGSRGLLNSSMAADASQAALYDRMLPIAQGDTQLQADERNRLQDFLRSRFMAEQGYGHQRGLADQSYDHQRGLADQAYGHQQGLNTQMHGYNMARDAAGHVAQMDQIRARGDIDWRMNASNNAARIDQIFASGDVNAGLAELDANIRSAHEEQMRGYTLDDRNTMYGHDFVTRGQQRMDRLSGTLYDIATNPAIPDDVRKALMNYEIYQAANADASDRAFMESIGVTFDTPMDYSQYYEMMDQYNDTPA